MSKRNVWAAAAGALALAASACGSGSSGYMTSTNTGGGGGGAGGGGGTGSAAVTIVDYSFSPATSSVKVGGSVDFTNTGAAVHHPVADNGAWDAGDLAPAQTGAYGQGNGVGGMNSITFNTAGTFTYHCTIHPSMTGTVTVTN